MRPLRLLILLSCFIALPTILTFLSLLSAHSDQAGTLGASYGRRPSRLRALFAFHTPSSLFPPSAVISLTDDNSTFFLARPAAFGSSLPSKGLSAQLWVGSGFGDDNMRRGGAAQSAEGELGCSDVPGWGEGDEKHSDEQQARRKPPKNVLAKSITGTLFGNVVQDEKETDVRPSEGTGRGGGQAVPHENDGTDDHLHHPLAGSNPAEPAKPGQSAEHESTNDKSKTPTHADIQSLQESAEISGKVVLLSRGGCGFLEKVKWVQRRGGIGLIVGDDERGGPLIVMYARGDTSNVTIPALFTSHTTAHLLSSLIPSETFDEPAGDDFKGTTDIKGKKGLLGSKTKTKAIDVGPIFTTTETTPQPTGARRPSSDQSGWSGPSVKGSSKSWTRRMLSVFGLKGDTGYPWHMLEDSRRPPSSGNIDWVLVQGWENEEPIQTTDKKDNSRNRGASGNADGHIKSQSLGKSDNEESASDDFVIGVQDWRDRDLVAPERKPSKPNSGPKLGKPGMITKPGLSTSQQKPAGNPLEHDSLKGGSITPGSGEYDDSDVSQHRMPGLKSLGEHAGEAIGSGGTREDTNDASWLSCLRWSQEDSGKSHSGADSTTIKSSSQNTGKIVSTSFTAYEVGQEEKTEHEGLWVTLTPTNMSTSPFFDTLLVLVVSPLVTLTVVYALLLLRSRIRRRRWRAPKSVVDRLPVRTYHTMSSSSSTTLSQLSTPRSSSPTSPPLRSVPRPVTTRSRPRSQTTSSIVPASGASHETTSTRLRPQKENDMRGSAWRKRYTGRQVECVVCLEEYIDGQSRVMSLPCGHEFHVECITPWLVRRRRTCPICKGDVVRSMAYGSEQNDQREDGEATSDDVQTRAAETVNDSLSAAIPIPPRLIDEDSDVERGADPRERPEWGPQPASWTWRNLVSSSLSALSGETVWRQSPADRSR